jgi:nitrite reductase/ring-hydroxylating ferredoxin subunit/Fe-S cluster biogenesis protein NfuA
MSTTQVAMKPTAPSGSSGVTASSSDDPDFEALAGAVDTAAARVADLDPATRAVAIELQDAIEAFHRPALVHIVRTLRDDPRGKELLFQLVDDPNVRAIFALHGIIKPDIMTRARIALDGVRPYLQSHGGDVELVRIENGRAAVRLQGSCNGCSMSAVTLREGVEEALVSGVEEIVGIDVLEDEPTTAFIPLSSIGRKTNGETGWVQGPATSDVAAGSMLRFDVDTDGDTDSFIVTNIGNTFAVFRNACVHQGMTLDGGMIDDGIIVCPWHGFKFEATTGECISAPGAQLSQIPTRLESGHVWIRARGD